MATEDRQTYFQMVGYALREIGTLLVAFTPLYAMFDGDRIGNGWVVGSAGIGLGLVLLSGGMIVERVRA